MNAKKLTMAVASLMVLAAAFVLVVPSESDSAEEFEITDAYFQDYPTFVAVKVFFNQQAAQGGTFTLYYGDEFVKKMEIAPGSSDIRVKLGDMIPRGEYTAYITTPNGNDSTTILYPTPIEHTISVLATPAEGGQITADKTTAFFGDEVTLTITEAEGYKLSKLTLNGQEIQGTTFSMPDANVMVVAMFEPSVIYYDVTFMLSADMEPVTVKAVADQILREVPAAPGLIGAEFVGWFYEGADVAFDFETTPVTQNMTVYAHYGPVEPVMDEASVVFMLINEYNGNIGLAIVGVDGYVPTGVITVTVNYAYYEEELDAYVTDSEEIECELVSDGTDTMFGYVDITNFAYYENIFSAYAEFDADSLDAPAVTSKIYFEPVVEA